MARRMFPTKRVRTGRRRARSTLGLALAAVALLGGGAASAQNQRKLANETELSGDWGGLRTRLEQSGVKIAFEYWTNLAGNPVGGERQGFTYTDSLNLSIDLDFERLFSWKGGALHFTFTNRDGSSLSQNYIGNIFTVQQIYGPTETYRLTQLTLEQSFAGGVFDVVAGRYPASDFATSPLYCVFMNNGFCGYPGGIAQNLNMPYFPVPSWAGRLRWKPSAEFLAQVGAFEVEPDARRHARLRLVHVGRDGNGDRRRDLVRARRRCSGSSRPLQAGRLVSDAERGVGRPGAARAAPASPPAAALRRAGSLCPCGRAVGRRQGGLLCALRPGGHRHHAQMPFIRGAAEVPIGVTVLGGLSWAQGPNTVNNGAAFGGVIAHGLLAGRPLDTQGFAATWVNRTVPGQTYELVLEWNYGMEVTRWFRFQPDLQWIIRPGATGQIPNALVLGAQASIDF